MSPQRPGFTQRLALACARRPLWAIGLWLAVLAAAALVYLWWGDVFTSSMRVLNAPESEKAAQLIEDHGGPKSDSLTQTAAAVQSLVDGLGDAQSGADKLAKGAGSVSKGSKKLARGLQKLAKGAGKVSGGNQEASAGARSLSQGLSNASQGASSLSSGIAQVNGATGTFSSGLAKLSRGGRQLAGAAGKLANGAKSLAAGAGDVASGVSQASSSAADIATGATTLDQLVAAYVAAHPDAANDPTFQQIIAISDQLASGTASLSSGLKTTSAGASSVASGADDLASGAASLSSGAGTLSAGIDKSAAGARQLDKSMGRLASSSAALASGVSSAASGSQELASGAGELASGSVELASGVSSAATGADKVAKGTSAVHSGATDLSKGLSTASAGATKLNDAFVSVGSLSNNDSEVVIVRSDALTVQDPDFEAEVVRLRDKIAALPEADVASVLSRYDEGLGAATRGALTSDDKHATIIMVDMAVSSDQAADHVDGLYGVVEQADADSRFDLAVTGAGTLGKDGQELAEKDLRRGEAIGIPVALVILVIVFGALVAAGVPLVLAVFSIVIGLAITVGIGQGFELSIFAFNLLVMIGLAVGIDYSLFIVSRYREERRLGLDPTTAIGVAAGTASKAVFFSGMTVVLALAGMLIVPISAFVSVGIGAMSAVFVAVAAALALLPAILALLGDRIDALRVPWLDRYSQRRTGKDSWWGRTARAVMRRPVVYLVLGMTLLIALATPALLMKTGGFSAEQFPSDYMAKRGLDMLERDFPAGMSEPINVVVDGDLSSTTVQDSIQSLADRAGEGGQFTVTGLTTSADQTLAVLQMVQDADATSEEAKDRVQTLRNTLVPESFHSSGAVVYIGGRTAEQMDTEAIVTEYTPIVIALVLALSFILLLVAFRSVVVAITAILMNLLSVGASYGALTLLFQFGWGADLLGLIRVDAIEVWIPLFMFCVLFGLSMDYQVFLLSRIREHWDQTRDSRESVVFGVQSTAGIITGAALIMAAVFLGMGSGQMVVLQQLGFGLAVAILLDAFAVRTFVAPAMIGMFGDRYWWMPRWLEWLPKVDVEGSSVSRTASGDAVRGP